MSDPTPEPPSAPEPGPDTTSAETQGGDRIQAALDRLDGLPDRPLREHPDAFEELHIALTDALSSIDEV